MSQEEWSGVEFQNGGVMTIDDNGRGIAVNGTTNWVPIARKTGLRRR